MDTERGVNAGLEVKMGWSAHKNTQKALDQALAPLAAGKDSMDLVLLYCSIKHDSQKVVAEVNRRLGSVPIMGCTTTGEMCPGGLLQGGMVLAGLSSDALTAAVGHGQGVYTDPAGAAQRALSMAQRELEPRSPVTARNRICLVHTAGFTLDKPGVEEDVLEALKAQLGEDWLIMGGSAGDDIRFIGNHQFAGRQVFDDAVVLSLITTDLEVAHAMEHGYVPTEQHFVATETAGNLVKSIDGRRALDFYADLLRVPPSRLTTGLNLLRMTDKVPKFLMSFSQKVGLTPQKITDNIPFFTYSVENPFGVKTDSGAYAVKVPKVITPEGFIEFQVRIPQGTPLQLMKLDRERTLDASARAIARVTESLGADPQLTLVYECGGRYMYLYREIDALMSRISASTSSPLVGFFTSAEQGVMEGMACQTHNYSTSILALGRAG